MGGQFFAPLQKLASHDPLAGALNLPGSHTYAQQQNQRILNSPNATGAYTGIAPTLAGANAGYQPGGPGANQWHQGGFFNVGAPAANPYASAAQQATTQPFTKGNTYGQ